MYFCGGEGEDGGDRDRETDIERDKESLSKNFNLRHLLEFLCDASYDVFVILLFLIKELCSESSNLYTLVWVFSLIFLCFNNHSFQ